VDLFLVDLKFLDDTEHCKWTGVSNRPVLENLLCLARENKPVVVRTPIIGGLNDRPEHIQAIADWLRPLGNVLRYELLPYHPLGTGKYAALGYAPPPPQFAVPAVEAFERLAVIARRTRKSEG
jgi:pyruvate-formate lyase-activating enzyme